MITSRQNPIVKRVRALADKKFRDKFSEYVAEGVKSVEEAIITGQNIALIVTTERNSGRFENFGGITETVSDEIFRYISEEENPQGVLAVIKKPKPEIKPVSCDCLFLDGVRDPSNVGAIIRTAAATGITEIFAANSADAYAGKAVRASMSGIFRVNVYSGTRETLLPLVKCPIIVADMGGENVFTTNVKGSFCLALGNESKGVSETLKNAAEKTVAVPMRKDFESLNVAVAAGVTLYALLNNRKGE